MFQFTKILPTLSELQTKRRLSRLWSFYFVPLFQGNRSFEKASLPSMRQGVGVDKDPLFISPLCASQGGERISPLRRLSRLTRSWALVVLISCLLPMQGDAQTPRERSQLPPI